MVDPAAASCARADHRRPVRSSRVWDGLHASLPCVLRLAQSEPVDDREQLARNQSY